MAFPSKSFKTISKEKHRELSAKGGAAGKNNPKSIIGGRLGWMKRTNNWDDTELNWFKERMDNPQASAIHIEDTLEKHKDRIPPDKYMAMMATIHRLKFGDKIQIDQRRINVNIELSEDRKNDLLEKFSDLN